MKGPRILAPVIGLAVIASVMQVSAQTVAEDSGLYDSIAQFTSDGPNGATLPLADIADIDWDIVYAFSATMPVSLIKRTLGDAYQDMLATPSMLDNENEAVLVFLKDGQIVQRIEFDSAPWLVGADAKAYGPSARLRVHTKDPGPYVAVRLTD